MTAPTISLPVASDYFLADIPTYHDVHDLLPVFDAICFRLNLILQGDTGIAKSLSIKHWAAVRKIPVVQHWCSEGDKRESLVSWTDFGDNRAIHHLGPLPRAVEVANQTGKAVLLLEEVNALTPQTQKSINSLTDWHQEIETDFGFWRVRPGAKLWIVGTMNTSAYGGIFALNNDLKSRFHVLPLGYPSAAAEQQLLRQEFPDLEEKVIRQLLRLAYLTRTQAIEYALSPRDVLAMAKASLLVGVEGAVRLQSGKFEAEDRAVFSRWATAIFSDKPVPEEKNLARKASK